VKLMRTGSSKSMGIPSIPTHAAASTPKDGVTSSLWSTMSAPPPAMNQSVKGPSSAVKSWA